jgi:hypothetical protein
MSDATPAPAPAGPSSPPPPTPADAPAPGWPTSPDAERAALREQAREVTARLQSDEGRNDLRARKELAAEQGRLFARLAALDGEPVQAEPSTAADRALDDEPPAPGQNYFNAPDMEAEVLRAAGLDPASTREEAAEARATAAEGFRLAAELGLRPSELRAATAEIARDFQALRRDPARAEQVLAGVRERWRIAFGPEAPAVHARLQRFIATQPGLRDWLEASGAGNSVHTARALDRIARQRGFR